MNFLYKAFNLRKTTYAFSHISLMLALLVVLLSVPLAANAQNEKSPEELKYGVGLQVTAPAWGVSGMMDINEDLTAQLILGAAYGNFNLSAKGLYKFQKEEDWHIYGYGLLGFWGYDGYDENFNATTQYAPGLGAGAGFEYDLRTLLDNFPPIYWNVEVGLSYVNFGDVGYDYFGISFGGGLHYRFGGKK